MPTPAASEAKRSALCGSLVYSECRAEQEEILRHKWHLSEKAGRDVGLEYAIIDWVRHHRAGWLRTHRNRNAVA